MMARDGGRRRSRSDDAIAAAAHIVRGGGLIGLPTETVYGLAADATSDEAVARIYRAKGRPALNPLIAHVADIEGAERQGRLSRHARRLAEIFWPGPLTLVVPARNDATVCPTARAGLGSVALRVPAHPVAQAVIRAARRPLAAPSANRSGHVSAVTADHVLEDLGDAVDLVLDDGRSPIGVESTIVACLGDEVRLLRPGGLARCDIERELDIRLDERKGDRVIAPGALAFHYAPRSALMLDATHAERGDAVLDFAGRIGEADHRLDLSPGGDLVEASYNLYAFLRRLDALGCARIVAAPIPRSGLGEVLNDRLQRAAAPKPQT